MVFLFVILCANYVSLVCYSWCYYVLVGVLIMYHWHVTVCDTVFIGVLLGVCMCAVYVILVLCCICATYLVYWLFNMSHYL